MEGNPKEIEKSKHPYQHTWPGANKPKKNKKKINGGRGKKPTERKNENT